MCSRTSTTQSAPLGACAGSPVPLAPAPLIMVYSHASLWNTDLSHLNSNPLSLIRQSCLLKNANLSMTLPAQNQVMIYVAIKAQSDLPQEGWASVLACHFHLPFPCCHIGASFSHSMCCSFTGKVLPFSFHFQFSSLGDLPDSPDKYHPIEI